MGSSWALVPITARSRFLAMRQLEVPVKRSPKPSCTAQSCHRKQHHAHWAPCCRLLRLKEARAAERRLLHLMKPSFAYAAKVRFPPFLPLVQNLTRGRPSRRSPVFCLPFCCAFLVTHSKTGGFLGFQSWCRFSITSMETPDVSIPPTFRAGFRLARPY